MALTHSIKIVATSQAPHRGTPGQTSAQRTLHCRISCPRAPESTWHPGTSSRGEIEIIRELVTDLRGVQGVRSAEYVPFTPKRVVVREDPLHKEKQGFTQPLDREYGDFAPLLGLTFLFSIEGDEITPHAQAAIQAIFAQTMLADAA